jgi:F0F1-type ATP synthase assembly protein I
MGVPAKEINWRQGLVFLGIGIELVTFTIGGYFLGAFLDESWGTKPWLMISGLLLGAAAGMVHLFRLASRFF